MRVKPSDLYLYPIRKFVQHLKFQKVLNRYDNLYSMGMFGESIDGHKYGTLSGYKKDMELEVLRINNFDNVDK